MKGETAAATVAATERERPGAMPQPRGRGGRPLSARSPGAEAGSCAVSDPCAAEEIWRPWRVCIGAEDPGELGFRRRYVRTPGVELYRDTFDGACRLRGLPPADSLVFLVPLRLGPRSRYWHRPTGKDRLPAMHRGGVDWVLDRGHSHLMLVVKQALAQRRFGEESCTALERAASTYCVPARPGDVRRHGEWLSRLVDDLSGRPELFLGAEASEAVEEQLLRRLEQTIDFDRAASLKPAASPRRRGLQCALAHLSAADLPAVTVSRLVEVAGVSQRTLELAFRDTFDLTPNGFLRRLRLHAARRELATARADGTTVGEVADRNGFPQHGRFSACYRRLFGESPSETLRRPSGGSAAARTRGSDP
jgi:AraC family ethanolamine operon transcriptional activator